MENNNQQAASQTAGQELPSIAMHPRYDFSSEEEMKTYYLQLTNIMNIKFVGESPELMSLNCLRRKLKQFIHLMQLLGTHEWGKGIAEIQNACGAYMLQNNLDRKTLLCTNQEIGQHLQFIISLASHTGLAKQMEGILYYHYQNILQLLNKLREEPEKQ